MDQIKPLNRSVSFASNVVMKAIDVVAAAALGESVTDLQFQAAKLVIDTCRNPIPVPDSYSPSADFLESMFKKD